MQRHWAPLALNALQSSHVSSLNCLAGCPQASTTQCYPDRQGLTHARDALASQIQYRLLSFGKVSCACKASQHAARQRNPGFSGPSSAQQQRQSSLVPTECSQSAATERHGQRRGGSIGGRYNGTWGISTQFGQQFGCVTCWTQVTSAAGDILVLSRPLCIDRPLSSCSTVQRTPESQVLA